ncbi:hypothetical protein F5Y16DRAFT_118102 [Xylariaceae sp. FL0255]|nr:hypothetical protein F5Y16DRAFT_118102 [Xylariaceae sp. FL0255]
MRKGYGDIRISLVDTWKIRAGGIHPATFLAKSLGVIPLGKAWHDDPYHEYFVLGDVPLEASLGSVGLRSATGREINALLPGFGHLDRQEGLHESLRRFKIQWTGIFGGGLDGVGVTDEETRAAFLIAQEFLQNCDPDIHFQIAMMFLSLRKREWNGEVWTKLQVLFRGVWLLYIMFWSLDFTNFVN